MKVKATKRGWNNVILIEPGMVFDVPDGVKGSWFEPVEAPKEVKVDPKKHAKKGEGDDE